MPTRTDAQGLMMCEMATYGMPVITTDIPVCHEVLDSFENVSMFDINDTNVQLEPILAQLESGEPYKKNPMYFNSNTSAKEVEMLKTIIK